MPSAPDRPTSARPIVTACIAAALVAACHGPGVRPDDARLARALDAETDRWHAERLERLTAEDGWLTLVGLCWLEPGPNRVGADASARVRYEGLPADTGVITVSGDAVRFAAAPGVAVDGVDGAPADGRLVTDADGDPTVLAIGPVRLHVIERGGRLAVRIRDAGAPGRRAFTGIDRFPVDPAWRIEAVFRPAASTAWVPVASVIGTVSDQQIAGRASFTAAGHACDVVLMPGSGPDDYFVVFGDASNGITTHGGGRFLVAERGDDDGTVVLDFNRAYNPPCAFTAYATCPLPVADNRLPFAVEAGERRP